MALQAPRDHTLVTAINTFYESVQQSSPYKQTNPFTVLSAPAICCTWFHSNKYQSRQISNSLMFICDESSFSVLKLSLMKVSILAEGIAWPHITSHRTNTSVQWIILGHEMGSCPNCLLPPPFNWFIVTPAFQKIFEYTIGLLNLDVKEIPSNIKHCCWSGLMTFEEDVFLKMIISSPGALLLTILSPNDSSYNTEFGHERSYCTQCVASKSSQWYKETKSTKLHLMEKITLDHHVVVNQIPGNLQSIVYLTLKGTMGRTPTVMSLEEGFSCGNNTEACGKELLNSSCDDGGNSRRNVGEKHLNGEDEKLQIEEGKVYDKLLEFSYWKSNVNCRNDSCNVSELSHSNVLSQPWKVWKCSKCVNSFRFKLLECPKCKKMFRFGMRGNGLKYLMGHVYDHHKRLTGYCISMIKRNYADPLNDASHEAHCYFPRLKRLTLCK